MKRSISCTFALLLVLLCLLPSCGKKQVNEDLHKTAYSAASAQANGRIWKIHDAGSYTDFDLIRWYDPATGENGSLHADPNCSHELDAAACPFAGKQITSLAAVGDTVYFFCTEFSPVGVRRAWYALDYAGQVLTELAYLAEPDEQTGWRWCVSDGYLWYPVWSSAGDGKTHIRRVLLDGTEEEDLTPEGIDGLRQFYVEDGILYVAEETGRLRRVDTGKTYEHVSNVSDGYLYLARNNENTVEQFPEAPDPGNSRLRVYDLWRVPIDGGEDEAIPVTERIWGNFFFFDRYLAVNPADSEFVFSYLPTKKSSEEERIYVYDYSGGKIRLIDTGNGESAGEIALGDLILSGVLGVSEDWVVIDALDCTGIEPIGEKKAAEGFTEKDRESRVASFRIDRKTGEVTKADFGFKS
ncbi:MAG: hypothetical protein IKZ41_01045 [Clostridia bacterium]|nr:hypothetical protein [Clostridia bacterium]MBR5366858.1 hypothetical protein [Clostridia bacterium]